MAIRTYYEHNRFYLANEEINYSKLIESLEEKVAEKIKEPKVAHQLFQPGYSGWSKEEYAKALKRQIAQKSRQKSLDLKENNKNNKAYCDFATIPQLPESVQRKKKLIKMNEISKELSKQINLKKCSEKMNRSLEIKLEKESIDRDKKLFYQDRILKAQQKKLKTQELINAWNKAKKVKKLQNLLEISETKQILINTTKSPKPNLI